MFLSSGISYEALMTAPGHGYCVKHSAALWKEQALCHSIQGPHDDSKPGKNVEHRLRGIPDERFCPCWLRRGLSPRRCGLGTRLRWVCRKDLGPSRSSDI